MAPSGRLCAHQSCHPLHQEHNPFPVPLKRQKGKGVSDKFYLSPLLGPDGVLGTISVQHMERGVFQLCYLVGLQGKEDAKMLLIMCSPNCGPSLRHGPVQPAPPSRPRPAVHRPAPLARPPRPCLSAPPLWPGGPAPSLGPAPLGPAPLAMVFRPCWPGPCPTFSCLPRYVWGGGAEAPACARGKAGGRAGAGAVLGFLSDPGAVADFMILGVWILAPRAC